MKKKVIATIIAMLAILASNASAVSDDFSTDSGQWTYIGTASRDVANEYVVLTDLSCCDNKIGQIWLNELKPEPFIVKFKYKAGGGTGADGLVFMFNKKSEYIPDYGGSLGFSAAPHMSLTPVPGYGIEFDNFYNGNPYNDPSGNHIALIKDHPGNHLISIDDARTADNQWHSVEVKVGDSNLELSIDGSNVLSWSGTIDRTYGKIGFSAATGAANNWHIIDDFSIEDISINVAIDIKPGSYPNSFNNNEKGVIPVAVLGRADFNVRDINPDTVMLEGLAVKAVGKGNKLLAHYEDVNGDGYEDLVVQIEDSDSIFSEGCTTAKLSGNLNDGASFEGTDEICIVP